MSERVDAIVVGGGLAGLAAAITLHKAGKQVLLLEADSRLGGRVKTDEVDGLLLDRGFQILNPSYPELQKLGVLHELDLHNFDAGVMVATKYGIARIADPRRNPWWLPTTLINDVGDFRSRLKLLPAFARVWLRSSLNTPKDRAGSVRDQLLADGVSQEIYEKLFAPFLTGVFLESPEQVAAGYGDFVLRSFIKGTPALPARGMGALPLALARRLPEGAIKTNVLVTAVRAGEVETNQGVFKADKIIVAVNPWQARQWYPQLNVAETCPCVTWYHTTTKTPTISKTILVDGLHRGPVLNSVAISQVAPGYASGGRTLISSTTLGRDSSADAERAVREQLSQMWRVKTDKWTLVRAEVVDEALPVLAVGSSMQQQIEVEPGVWLAGDHRTSPSQQGALLSGRLAAEAALHKH